MGQPVEQPASAIYFRKDSGTMAKGLGARIRDQGAMVRLIWAHLFRGPDDMVENVKAVVIEADAPNAANIAKCYSRFASDCEIHFVDSEGKFIDEPDHIKRQLGADASVQGAKFVDPKAALANLKSAAPEPEPVPEEQQAEDVGEPPAEIGGEVSFSDEPDDTPARYEGEDAGTEHDSGVHSEEVSLEDDSDR